MNPSKLQTTSAMSDDYCLQKSDNNENKSLQNFHMAKVLAIGLTKSQSGNLDRQLSVNLNPISSAKNSDLSGSTNGISYTVHTGSNKKLSERLQLTYSKMHRNGSEPIYSSPSMQRRYERLPRHVLSRIVKLKRTNAFPTAAH